MFVERNVFHLKFGNARQAVGMWKEFLEKAHRLNNNIHARLLTDITGRGYTIILELSYNSFTELEPSQCSLTKTEGWKEFYQRFIPLCEFSERNTIQTGSKLLNLDSRHDEKANPNSAAVFFHCPTAIFCLQEE